MELTTAIHLIEKGIPKSTLPQRWVDLGAGTGLFTQALSTLLSPQSFILAIDRNKSSLPSISINSESVILQTQVGNFMELGWGKNWNGILMANALHYVSDAKDFIKKLKLALLPSGRLMVVEYERRQTNAWVPYPIDFNTLNKYGEHAGFNSINKLEETPSIYGDASIYSAVLTYGQ